MEDIKTGGPAFPTAVDMAPELHEGMTLRDYFAAKAMQGLLANPGGPIQRNEQAAWALTNCTFDDVAEFAHELADAMLAAREGGAK